MDRVELIQNEIVRLDGLIEDLARDWRWLRWSAALLPLTGLVFLASSAGIAVLYFLTVGGFWLTSFYLIGVRRREYIGEIAQLKLDKARLQR